MKFFTGLVDLLIPKKCFICEHNSKKPFCGACVNDFAFFSVRCKRCGKPVLREADACSFCRANQLYFDRGWSMGAYEGNLKQAVLFLKYDHGRQIASQLAELILSKADKSLLEINFVTCVPTTTYKFIKRGYNQSALLAQNIAKQLGKPFLECLYRSKSITDQMKLDKQLRKTNVKGAFKVKKGLKGLDILLVDDVLTTASTVNECARVLKHKGAKRVNILTVARA